MNEKEDLNKKTCPICKKEYTGIGAISRKDNKTEICRTCGNKEAFADYENYLNKKEKGN